MTRHPISTQKTVKVILLEEAGFPWQLFLKCLTDAVTFAPQTRDYFTRIREEHYVRRNNPAAHSEYIEVVLQSFDTVESGSIARRS